MGCKKRKKGKNRVWRKISIRDISSLSTTWLLGGTSIFLKYTYVEVLKKVMINRGATQVKIDEGNTTTGAGSFKNWNFQSYLGEKSV